MTTIDNQTTHADRPTCRRLLPFRFTKRDNGDIEIWYDHHYADGQKGPSMLELVGGPGSSVARLYTPLGNAIYELAQMFWNIEAELDTLAKQRDEAVIQSTMLTGEHRDKERSQAAREIEERRREASRKVEEVKAAAEESERWMMDEPLIKSQTFRNTSNLESMTFLYKGIEIHGSILGDFLVNLQEAFKERKRHAEQIAKLQRS